MKKLSYLLSTIVLFSVLLTVGCKKKSDPGPSDEQLQLDRIAKAWTVTAAQLGSEDVTDGFTNFSITINDNLGYNASGSTRDPQPWPSSGSFSFNDGDLNTLVRNDGLEMTLNVNDEGTTMTLSFTFVEATHQSGRVEAIDGAWSFNLVAN